ncbi:GNAT family N-acetyltransferase [Paracoccus tegillarcae]|uniref:GNAT family N-acetyltransferase n=1 Tax=Paracoccus tegillarcae TaxID=1529068 RepID=UPI001300B1F4|nr:GNAT family N-acetyltransferase [Paracoccus tegillarcae]
MFLDQRLSGLAELSFGFPQTHDAYLGRLVLGPWAQSAGHGVRFLDHIEGLARQAGAPRLYLAVLDRNPRARSFWQRQGFQPTGDHRFTDQGHDLRRMMKTLSV